MVKPGYKQTEIGVIPEDWEVKPLKDIVIGSLKYGVNAPAIAYLPPLPNYIRITDISEDGRFLKADRASVKCTNPDLYLLKNNDICFARTGASTGKTYLYRPEDGSLVYAGFLIKASINPELADSVFVFHVLHTQRYWNWVSVTSMRSGQPGINGVEYSAFNIQYPKLSEQHRIAEALSNVDELIASLEKLIEKKKAIKQGVMLELLTGKQRLPGFSGEWKSVCLSDIGHFIKGSGISRADTNSGKLPAVRYGELYTKHTDYVKKYYSHISCDVAANAVPVTFGAILFAASGETKEEIGKCAAIIEKHTVYAGGDILIFIPDKSTHPVFLGTLLNIPEVCKQKAQRGQGDAIVHIHADSLSEIEVQIPEYDEQAAIADVLLSADREIDLMEMKITKARQVKQGMMQQLLTGAVKLT